MKNPFSNVKANEATQIIKAIGLIIGYILLIIGTAFFIQVNLSVFKNSAAFISVCSIFLILFPFVYILLSNFKSNKKYIRVIGLLLLLLDFALFLYIVLSSLVVDYFQPLSLSTVSSVLLIAGSIIFMVSMLLNFLLNRNNFTTIVAAVLILLLMSTGLIWANTQDYKTFSNYVDEPVFLFKPGESGYATFRIPTIYTINKAYIDHGAFGLRNDPIYAFSEGRINSSHDKGDIDIVYKSSYDGGNTWSNVQTLLSFGDEVGKYGNPTIVLNDKTKTLHFFYMKASESSNYHYESFHSVLDINPFDLTLSIRESSTTNISLARGSSNEDGGSDGVRSDTLMMGPGKGEYIDNGTAFGRIVVPCSNNKHSFTIYSDDDGKTWENLDVPNDIKSAGLGNECEAVYVKDKLIMVTRENIPCANYHKEQYQRLSYSTDGGQTWEIKGTVTALKTPICMSSVANYKDNLIMTFPNDFNTRANLTLALSNDLGQTFKEISLYDGATGYSSVTTDSDGNVFVLAEVGKVNYNENLVFIKVNMSSFG